MVGPIPELCQGLPIVSAARIRELDRLASEKFGIPMKSLMDRAGTAVAVETEAFLKSDLGRSIRGAAVVVCCGRGANGGDGLVAASALAARGAQVQVFLCPPKKEEAGSGGGYPDYINDGIARARAAGAAVAAAGPESGLRRDLAAAAVVLDALLGTGAGGKPSGAVYHMIEEINAARKPVLAVDIPSGMEPDTGDRPGACVAAAETLTLGLAKRGLLAPAARKWVGRLKVLDIGYPAELVALAGIRRWVPLTVRRLRKGLYLIESGRFVNAYLVEGSRGLTLVDTGHPRSATALAAEIEAGGFPLREIEQIVLTHSHFDHAGGAAYLLDRRRVKVYAHPQDVPAILGRGALSRNGGFLPWVYRLALKLWFPYRPVEVVVPLEGGAHLRALPQWQILHTPGHTAGSVSLYQPTDRVLICGDALSNRNDRLGLSPSAYNEDTGQAGETAKKLSQLDCEMLCCGHGPVIVSGAALRIQEMLGRVFRENRSEV